MPYSLLFAPLWTVARQTPLSMGFSRQEYWSGLPCPPPGYLPDPEVEPRSPAVQVILYPFKPAGKFRAIEVWLPSRAIVLSHVPKLALFRLCVFLPSTTIIDFEL